MKPPIVAIEGHAILIFKTVEEAEDYLEPIDIENGEYDAIYDADGYLLRPEIRFVEEDRKFLWFGWRVSREKIVLVDNEPPIDKSSELRERLIAYLLRHRRIPDSRLVQVSLKDLIQEAYPTHY